MTNFLQNVIDAISLGSLFALLALGVALLYGIMRLINFAHGELIMIGGYALFLFADIPFVVRIALVVGAVVVAALGMERVAFRPVRGASDDTLLVTSFALSFLLSNIALVVFGSRPRGVRLPGFFSDSVTIGDLRISVLSILTVCVTIVLVGGLALMLKRTTIGIQMRAAAEDFNMARLLGVRANRIIAAAFAISGLLAAAAAFLLVAQSGSVSPLIGLSPVLIAFIATILGGLGSLPGSVLAAFTLGVLTVALEALLPVSLRPYRDAFVYGIVFTILLVRPNGLLTVKSAQVRV